jgi:hypothetical protein
LVALLVQLVGWQHCAGTQSSSVVQLCAGAGEFVTPETGVRVGDTVTTGGLPAVHPLARMKPAVIIRRMNTKPEVFPAMVLRFRRGYDNYLVGLQFSEKIVKTWTFNRCFNAVIVAYWCESFLKKVIHHG